MKCATIFAVALAISTEFGAGRVLPFNPQNTDLQPELLYSCAGKSQYGLVVPQPFGSVCGAWGQLPNGPVFDYSVEEKSFVTCRDWCMGNPQCKSFAFSIAHECTLFSKELSSQRFEYPRLHMGVMFYDAACFEDCVDTTVKTKVVDHFETTVEKIVVVEPTTDPASTANIPSMPLTGETTLETSSSSAARLTARDERGPRRAHLNRAAGTTHAPVVDTVMRTAKVTITRAPAVTTVTRRPIIQKAKMPDLNGTVDNRWGVKLAHHWPPGIWIVGWRWFDSGNHKSIGPHQGNEWGNWDKRAVPSMASATPSSAAATSGSQVSPDPSADKRYLSASAATAEANAERNQARRFGSKSTEPPPSKVRPEKRTLPDIYDEEHLPDYPRPLTEIEASMKKWTLPPWRTPVAVVTKVHTYIWTETTPVIEPSRSIDYSADGTNTPGAAGPDPAAASDLPSHSLHDETIESPGIASDPVRQLGVLALSPRAVDSDTAESSKVIVSHVITQTRRLEPRLPPPPQSWYVPMRSWSPIVSPAALELLTRSPDYAQISSSVWGHHRSKARRLEARSVKPTPEDYEYFPETTAIAPATVTVTAGAPASGEAQTSQTSSTQSAPPAIMTVTQALPPASTHTDNVTKDVPPASERTTTYTMPTPPTYTPHTTPLTTTETVTKYVADHAPPAPTPASKHIHASKDAHTGSDAHADKDTYEGKDKDQHRAGPGDGPGAGAEANDVASDFEQHLAAQIKHGVEDDMRAYLRTGVRDDIQQDVENGIRTAIMDDVEQMIEQSVDRQMEHMENDVKDQIENDVANDIASDIAKHSARDDKKGDKADGADGKKGDGGDGKNGDGGDGKKGDGGA